MPRLLLNPDVIIEPTATPAAKTPTMEIDTVYITDDGGYYIDIRSNDLEINTKTGQSIRFREGSNLIAKLTPTGWEGVITTGLIQGSQSTLASATNMAAPTTNTVLVSGTTTIVTMGVTGIQAGTRVMLRYGSAVQINHGGGGNGQFFMGGGVNRSAAAGARSEFVLMDLGGTLYWVETSYMA